MKPMPAAMGAARVPRRSFKTAYTSKKTKMMSATLRSSIIRLKYSVYGSSSNISSQIFSDQCSSLKSAAKNLSGGVRCFEKDLFHFRLGAFDSFFNLGDRFHDITGNQIRPQLNMSVYQNLFRRQVHR